jgi:hypothetical protein
MLKPTALALLFALLATSGISAEPAVTDTATWRWNVSAVLRTQQNAQNIRDSDTESREEGSFGQTYERYSTNGLHDPASNGAQH